MWAFACRVRRCTSKEVLVFEGLGVQVQRRRRRESGTQGCGLGRGFGHCGHVAVSGCVCVGVSQTLRHGWHLRVLLVRRCGRRLGGGQQRGPVQRVGLGHGCVAR